MSGKRPEGRSPEANILASPKYSKTLPSAASEPPVSPSEPKSRTGPLYDDRCTPADGTPERALPKRAETAAGPKGTAPVRQTHGITASFRRPPNDRVESSRHRPSPASGTTHTGNIPRNVLRRCPFHKYPKRLPFPTEERPPHRTRKTPRRPPAQTSGRTETPRHRHAEPHRGKNPPTHAQNGNKTGRRTAAPSHLHQNRNRRRRMAGRPQVPARPTSRKNDVPSAPPRQARSTQGTPSVPREVPVRPIAGYSPAMKSFISRSRASRRCNRRNWAHERCRLWVGCRIL